MKQDHTNMMAIANKRIGNVNLILNYWNRGEITTALSAISMINDLSVTMDVFNYTFSNGFALHLLTLDHATSVLPLALTLVRSKYECHVQVGLRTIDNVHRQFSEAIRSARTVPLFPGVDLAREERLKKGDQCLKQFKIIQEDAAMHKIAGKGNDLGKQATKVLNNLSYLLKSCEA